MNTKTYSLSKLSAVVLFALGLIVTNQNSLMAAESHQQEDNHSHNEAGQKAPSAHAKDGDDSVTEGHDSETEAHDSETEGHGSEENEHDHEGEKKEAVNMDSEMARANSIETQQVGPGTISQTTRIYGTAKISPDAVSHVTAQFPGRVTSVKVSYGEYVKKGQVLATIESNSSLQSYSVRAPISGTITAKHASSGEIANTETLFTITDSQSLWAELKVFPSQSSLIKPDQEVILSYGDETFISNIHQLIPNAVNEPYILARVPIKTKSTQLFPGMLLRGDVVVNQKQAALRIPNTALQEYEGKNVVFIKDAESFVPRPVELGLNDYSHVEVLTGLNLGDVIVVANSYLLKADLEKSGAAHSH